MVRGATISKSARWQVLASATMLATLSASCAGEVGADPATDGRHGGFTHKFMMSTGENRFAQLGYECFDCSFDIWLATEPPEGWTRRPAQVVVADDTVMRTRPSADGYPDAVDLTDLVPGDEYQLIVRVLDGAVVQVAPNLVAENRVMRDTVLTYSAGRRVHEITDPDGRVFVLFAFEVDPVDTVIPNFNDPTALGDVGEPVGWTYSSRVLEEELVLDTPNVATVLAIRGAATSAWQLR